MLPDKISRSQNPRREARLYAYRFTGKERDSESNLDNFGARYNASSIGRFMSPDWSEAPDTIPYATFEVPQSLNLYSYVGNSPSGNVDADGHWLGGGPPGLPETNPADCWSNILNCLSEVNIQDTTIFRKANDYLRTAWDAWRTSTLDSTCLAAATLAGASAGARAGVVAGPVLQAALVPATGGLSEAAGGPAGGAAAGALLGGAGGAAVGNLVGQIACRTGGGGGSGGGGGGGGCNGSKVRFGNNANQEYHTFRHVEEAGISKEEAAAAIRNDLVGKENGLPQGLTNGQVNVGGTTLRYAAFKLPDGTINVGRITVH